MRAIEFDWKTENSICFTAVFNLDYNPFQLSGIFVMGHSWAWMAILAQDYFQSTGFMDEFLGKV